MELEQRAVIFFLKRKGLKLSQIKQELDDVYHQDALDINSVKYWIHQFKLGRFEITNIQSPGRPVLDFIDTKIMAALEMEPFHSTYTLSETLSIPRSTINDHLKKLGFYSYNLRVVPYELTCEMKAVRIQKAIELLDILTTNKRKGFHRIITGDESWFFLSYDHKHMWSLSRENLPEIIDTKIHTKKYMVTIFWNIDKFFIVDLMKEGEKFNSKYFINNIISPLKEIVYPQGKKPKENPYTLHFDNALPHTSNASTKFLVDNGFKRAPQPPYSPDLAPSDFFLFGFLKNQLEGEKFDDFEQLHEKINEILTEISKETLAKVFDEWIERCQWVINNKGNYYHK